MCQSNLLLKLVYSVIDLDTYGYVGLFCREQTGVCIGQGAYSLQLAA